MESSTGGENAESDDETQIRTDLESSDDEDLELSDDEEPEPSGPDQNKNNHRSLAWDYFTSSNENGRRATCNTCLAVLCLPTGTTTPMFNHLRARHQAEWEQCEAKKRKFAEKQNFGGPRKRRKTGLSATEKNELDELLMEMIAIDLKPFSCVEDKGFKKVLSRLAPNYEPPCRTTFSRSLCPILYHKTREKLMKVLFEDLEAGLSSISFTTDCWKSKANDNYISLTLHYLSKNFTLKNVTLGMEQLEDTHTGRNLKQKLEGMMVEWNLVDIDNLPIYYVTDNARNISAAISQGGWEHIYCFAHTLQLTLHDARRHTMGVADLLAKVNWYSFSYMYLPLDEIQSRSVIYIMLSIYQSYR